MRRKKITIAGHAATTDAELATRASANTGLADFSHSCIRLACASAGGDVMIRSTGRARPLLGFVEAHGTTSAKPAGTPAMTIAAGTAIAILYR